MTEILQDIRLLYIFVCYDWFFYLTDGRKTDDVFCKLM